MPYKCTYVGSPDDFHGRARSTIISELCCFRAVTALTQNQIFCCRSEVPYKCTYVGSPHNTQIMLLRAVTALKQNNSGVIVDVAQPTKVVSRSQVRTLIGHFIGSKICDLEQNI